MIAESQNDILILYASQTGNAQYISEELSRELVKRDFITDVFSMDEYDVTNLPNEKFVILIASTTGQGEVPDNMKNFWKFLLIKELPLDSLAGIKFSVFGLGDSGYQKYNAAARKLYQRFLQLGATEFHERGLGDDQHEFGYDTEFVPWLTKLYESLKTHFPNKKYNFVESDEVPVSKFLVEFVNPANVGTNFQKENENSSLKSFKKNYCYNKEVILSKIAVNEKLTAEDAVKEVRYIELEFPQNNKVKYLPGDVAIVLPRNDPEVCKQLAEGLGYGYDQYVKISVNPNQKSKKSPYPNEPISIKDLFEFWLNVMTPPTRYFFRILSYFSTDELHKQKLREFGDNSNQGKIEYNQYCIKEKRNVYEILFDFGSVNLPLNFLLEAVSVQKPREYSISTSLTQHPNRVGLTIAMTEYFTPYKRKIQGLCTSWFCRAGLGEIVPLWIRRGTLPYPKDTSVPIICVGPGTGVAPHLSFLQERVTALSNLPMGPINTYLVFGNRNYDKDFIHRENLEKWDREQRIKLLAAFSRDQEQKIYVYHKIKEHKKELATLILENKNSIKILVCGNSKNMPKWVEETFVEILAEEIGVDNAKAFIQKLQNEARYVVEAW